MLLQYTVPWDSGIVIDGIQGCVEVLKRAHEVSAASISLASPSLSAVFDSSLCRIQLVTCGARWVCAIIPGHPGAYLALYSALPSSWPPLPCLLGLQINFLMAFSPDHRQHLCPHGVVCQIPVPSHRSPLDSALPHEVSLLLCSFPPSPPAPRRPDFFLTPK